MNELISKEVNFQGANLLAVQDQETKKIFVGVSYVGKGIGLTTDQIRNERKKVQENVVLKKGGLNLTLPTKGGNQEVLCIELDFLPLWLAKISITPKMQEEQPEVANNLIEYQLQAKNVLADAFVKNERLPLNNLSPQLQVLINLETKQKELETKISLTDHKVESIKEVVALNLTNWRKDTAHLLNRAASNLGGYEHIRHLREESYRLLEERASCSLSTRLTNKRRRMADEGICLSKRKQLNPLDVIADDKKLIEIYVAVVKEMAIKHGVAA